MKARSPGTRCRNGLRSILIACAVSRVLAATLPAGATTPGRATEPAPATATIPTAAPEGRWGYWLVIGSLAAGSALTTYGLSISCRRSDIDCQRGASVAIWGGVGLASAGSIAGITIVQSGRRASRGTPPRTALRLELAPLLSLSPSRTGTAGSGLALRLVAD